MGQEATSKPINLSDDIVPRVFSYFQQSVVKYVKNSFVWFGPTPRVTITDPEIIKDVLNKNNEIRKNSVSPLVRLLVNGLVNLDGE
ncbi:unnamed protein product [Lathyrus sativus]|nr:unnamed protein product [Lathyrus sativus]